MEQRVVYSTGDVKSGDVDQSANGKDGWRHVVFHIDVLRQLCNTNCLIYGYPGTQRLFCLSIFIFKPLLRNHSFASQSVVAATSSNRSLLPLLFSNEVSLQMNMYAHTLCYPGSHWCTPRTTTVPKSSPAAHLLCCLMGSFPIQGNHLGSAF